MGNRIAIGKVRRKRVTEEVHTHKWMFTSLLSNNNKPSQLRKAICPL
jgi:hypothetical protein